MPLLYYVQCTNCHRFPLEDAEDNAESLPNNDGFLISEEYVVFRRDDGEFVPLPHPNEREAIAEQGTSLDEATRAGRLYLVTLRVCANCGGLQKHRAQVAHVSGRKLTLDLLMAGSAFVVAFFYFGIGLILALLTGIAVLVAMSMLNFILARLWLLVRGSATQREGSAPAPTCCTMCGGNEIWTLQQAMRQAMICSHCKTRSVHYTRGGIA